MHREWPGDGSVATLVNFLDNTHAWAKAGVMFRETLSPGSKHVMLVQTPRRNPISPTAPPTWNERREPAASVRSTSPAIARRPQATNTIAPMTTPARMVTIEARR